MKNWRSFCYPAVACTLLWAQGVRADEFGFEETLPEPAVPEATQEDLDTLSSAGVSVGYAGNTDGKSGEYNALHRDGPFVSGWLDIRQRAAWNSGETRFWILQGNDLGLDNGDISFEYGNQGQYRFRLGFDQVEHVDRNNAISPFTGTSTNLTLPAGFNANDASFYHDEDLGKKRETFSVEADRTLNRRWQFESRFSHETKKGDKATGAGQGFSGTALAIEPIDYTFDNASVSLRYATDLTQWQFGYEFSRFANEHESLTFLNPKFAGIGPQQLALAPDNYLQRLFADGGYNLGAATRLNTYLSYSQSRQDEKFLPYSADPTFGAYGTAQPLPRDSLEGRVDETVLRLSLATRIRPRLNLRASYRFEDRDNRTPDDLYDFLAFNGGVTTDGWANKVFSHESHDFGLDATYRSRSRHQLRVGYDYELKTRKTDKQVGASDIGSNDLPGYENETLDQTAWTEVRFPEWHSLTGSIRLSRSHRKSDLDAAFEASIAADDGTPPEYLLERDRDRIQGQLSYPLSRVTSVSLQADLSRSDYRDNPFGLQRMDSDSYTFDLNHAPDQSMSAHAYLGYQEFRNRQKSRNNGGDRPAPVSGQWRLDADNAAWLTGIGLDWTALPNRLDLGMNYRYLHAVDTVESRHVTLGSNRLPETRTRIHSIDVNADITLQKNLTVTTRYQYEKYRGSNWAWNDAYFSTLAFGWDEPDYDTHLLMLGLRYDF